MQKKCKLCRINQQQLIYDKLQSKYFEAFNFYFAKPINEILQQVTNTPHVIYFKDFAILDENQEYLKRFYKQEEVKPRLDILTEFYVTNYKETHPYLLIVEQHSLMSKRNKRVDKLYYQRMQESEHSIKSPQPNVLNSKLSSDPISFETEEHDIYSIQEPLLKVNRLDFKGLNFINQEDNNQLTDLLIKQYLNINLMTTHQKQLPPQYYIKSPPHSQQNIQLIKDLHQIKNVKRRNVDIREKKVLLANSKSESKHSQSSFKISKIKDSVDQPPVAEFGEVEEGKGKLTRNQSDNLTIQKMLKDNRQLRSTISQDLIVASTSTVIQGFQGSQKSIKHENNGSIQNISQKQEQLKKVYQPSKKINQFNQIDKITKGGCLTDRNHKLPIAEDLFNKLHEIKIRSSQNADNKKPEFNYMIPSQYNALSTFRVGGNNSKAKSQYTKKTSDLGAKSQHQQTNHSQSKVLNLRTDDIVKKYIQMATQTIQQHKKFDFKLNLQNLNNENEDDFCNSPHAILENKRLNFLSERHSQQQQERDQFTTHRKIVIK